MKEDYPYRTADGSVYGKLKELAKQNRSKPTEAERILWSLIKGGKLGQTFKRQHIIGDFIVDFVCLDSKLVVEIDGGYHHTEDQPANDGKRTKRLNEMGFNVIRFDNEEVIGCTDTVLKTIKENLK